MLPIDVPRNLEAQPRRHRFWRRRSRPKVVMLVYNTVEHDARVRRSARSLARAGCEVTVLGVAREGDSTTRSWEGFELRLVPRRDPLVERDRRARHRADVLGERRERIRGRVRGLRDREASLGLALRFVVRAGRKLYEWRLRRVQLGRESARETVAEAREAKTRRARRDPLGLHTYEKTWWPIVRRLRPDVVHVHDAHGLLVARRAADRGARWIFDAHEDPLKKGGEEEGRDEVIRREVARHLPHADAVITVSAPLAERLRRTFHLRRQPTLVHNTPALHGPALTRQPGLRELAGVGPDTALVVYAGSMTRRRKISVVLEALEHLEETHLALVVSPDNSVVLETVDLAERLGVGDRVHVVPKVPPEELVEFLSEADVGVHPLSRYSNADIALPNKLFEYLHAGLPVVVSECPAMASFVRRHGLGEIAPVDDSAAWAEAIDSALRNSSYRERVEDLETLREEWSWERQEDELLDVYRQVLEPDFAREAPALRLPVAAGAP